MIGTLCRQHHRLPGTGWYFGADVRGARPAKLQRRCHASGSR